MSFRASAQPGFVSETPSELSTTGDFDGDGRGDVVIVDRVTGAYRIGYQLAADAYTWPSPRASGVNNVTGFAAGRFYQLNRDALAFTSPEANRINLLDASSPASAGVPISAFILSLGPNLVVPIEIGGLGGGCVANEAHDDLFVTSILNGGAPTRFTTVRNNGASQCVLFDGLIPPWPARGNRVVLKAGQPSVVGLLLRGASEDTFQGYDLAAGAPPLAQAIAATQLPSGADYVFGNFDGSAYRHFLFYLPGFTNIAARQVQELLPPVAGRYQFGPLSTLSLSDPIRQMFALPGAGATKLLILFGNGETARVYDYNGAGPLALVQEFTAPAGEQFTGAAVLPDYGFMMLSGNAAFGTSIRFQVHNFSGGSYVAGASGGLPPVSSFSALANVFQYQRVPFVDQEPPPTLLRSLKAGDWSAGFKLGPGGPPPPLTVTNETFVSSAQGLDNPTALALGPAHLLASEVLVNQYREFISLFGLSPAVGDEISEVSIAPPPGQYKTSVTISFKPSTAGDEVWFRFGNAGNWMRYGAAGSFSNLFDNTTVYFYAKPPGLGFAKSSIHSAAYSFTESPATRDSDGDGVPDYVEISKGLDPVNSGNDADGDGYSDLEELLAGTDPNDAASFPTVPDGPDPDLAPDPAPKGFEQGAAFDLALVPRPLDGTSNRTSLCLTNPILRVFDAHGSLLSVGLVTNDEPAGADFPAATLTNILFDSQQRLVVAATELHYDILTTNADPRIGREMLALTPVPALTRVTVPYRYGYGDLATERNNWITSARNAYRVNRQTIFRELTIHDSLAALLVERKVAQVLESRGADWWTNVTLFPFRASDVSRVNPSEATLLSLESHGDTNKPPAYALPAMLATISGAIQTAATANIQALTNLLSDLYRISSAHNNTSPGTYASPIDALRAFVATGNLDTNYLAKAVVTPDDLVSAYAGVSNVLALVGTRPVTNLFLVVGTESFSDTCTVLTNVSITPAPKSLFDAEGRPFRFPDAFNLLPGSQVQVCGYTDVSAGGCAGDAIEVITASLLTVPVASDADSDGNLLPDSWERQFLAGLGLDGLADDDGDGYSNLQEMFEGTDPKDDQSMPGGLAVDLQFPLIQIELPSDGRVRLRWSWPLEYVDRVIFSVRASGDVAAPFEEVLREAPHVGGVFDVTLDLPGSPDAQFFVITMTLR